MRERGQGNECLGEEDRSRDDSENAGPAVDRGDLVHRHVWFSGCLPEGSRAANLCSKPLGKTPGRLHGASHELARPCDGTDQLASTCSERDRAEYGERKLGLLRPHATVKNVFFDPVACALHGVEPLQGRSRDHVRRDPETRPKCRAPRTFAATAGCSQPTDASAVDGEFRGNDEMSEAVSPNRITCYIYEGGMKLHDLTSYNSV